MSFVVDMARRTQRGIISGIAFRAIKPCIFRSQIKSAPLCAVDEKAERGVETFTIGAVGNAVAHNDAVRRFRYFPFNGIAVLCEFDRPSAGGLTAEVSDHSVRSDDGCGA